MAMFSVIMPAHNEERSIVGVVTSIHEALKGSGMEYEVIVVDDGSMDGTAQVLRDSGQNVRVIEHGTNLGYGASLKTGIRHARFDLIVMVDADGSHPVEEIPRLVKQAQSFDTVIGARTGKGSISPLIRRPPKWVLRKLAEYLSESKIPDLNSGFRVVRKTVVEKFMRLLPSGFSFSSTLTIAMHVNGYSIKYVPVTCRQRTGGHSKIRPVYDTLNFLQLIMRTILYFAPLKIFLPLSFLILLAGAGVFLYSYFVIGEVMDITTILLVISALQIFSIGLLADLMDKRM
jgi:glycosyltransferase involved in cell wall biosynthesis